jgi:hypothetical protein
MDKRLRRLDASTAAHDQWEPLGVAEYKLVDGRSLRERGDGSFVVVESGLELRRQSH